MLEQVNVYYEGWGERWLWGTLMSTTALTGRPQIMFEYSNEARQRGLELSSYTLPLEGTQLRRGSPHQLLLGFRREDKAIAHFFLACSAARRARTASRVMARDGSACNAS